jgi:hypothetical protein
MSLQEEMRAKEKAYLAVPPENRRAALEFKMRSRGIKMRRGHDDPNVRMGIDTPLDSHMGI